MAKIKRKFFVQYIQAQITPASYERLGHEIEELTVEMGANVVKSKDVLGNTATSIDTYEKSMSVEPYKADAGTPLHTWLQSIVDEEKTLDDLNTNIVEVHLWEEATGGAYPAYKEDVVVEVVSYGGNTEAYQIPFNVHYTGNRTKGKFNPTTKTFTADAG